MSGITRMIAAVIVAVSVGTAMGQATLEGVRLGQHAGGPAVTVNDLKGRVVMFEYWGINCGICLMNIPHVTEMQKKYSREQFIVIANQCQGGTAENAGAVWLARAKDDVVTVVNDGSLPGSNVTGIPRCFVFDATGKLVFDGSPAEAGPVIDKAVKASPGFLVAGHDFKVMTREAQVIGAMRSNLSGTIKRLRAAADDEKNAGNEEAKYLLGRLTEWSDEAYAGATARPVTDALEVVETTRKMATLLRGDEMGDRWVELDKSLRSDKTFAGELQAAKLLAMLQEQAMKSSLFSEAKVSESRMAADKASIKGQLEELARRYPDTAAAKKAAQYMIAWKL